VCINVPLETHLGDELFPGIIDCIGRLLTTKNKQNITCTLHQKRNRKNCPS